MAWTLPAGVGLDSPPVVSPDGRRVVFVGVKDSTARLMVWRLDETSPRAIPGTEGAKQPFWSPAGDAIGFFARQKLMKVALADGAPVELADAPDGRGGTWSGSGTILFGRDLIESPIFQVSDRGGTATPVTRLDVARRDNSHRWPAFLPDGVHFLYFVRSEVAARRGVYVRRLGAPDSQATMLLRSESEALYVPGPASSDTGHVLYVADGRLEARPFDARRIALAGDARIVATPVGGNTPYHAAMFGASRDVLAFAADVVPYGARLGSVDRSGDSLVMSEPEVQGWPRLSPDGKWLARQRVDDREGNPDIWVESLERGTRVRVTTDPQVDLLPVWSPDGRQLAYVSDARGKAALSIAAADGTGVLRTIPCPGLACEPTDWSSDGRELLVTVQTASGVDVWAVSTEPTGGARPVLAEEFDERDARISRHGWIAYVSNETGRNEVSVRSRSGNPRRMVISSAGGTQPVWRSDGSELFFVDQMGRLSSVSIRPAANGGLTFGAPIVLNVPLIGAGHWGTQYDVSPDGRRVYFMDRANQPPSPAINVVLGWRALLP
jgi:Tol biopolymer transport system component